MTTQFLVINSSEGMDLYLSITERLRLFNSAEEAVKHAESLGFKSFYGPSKINTKVGMSTTYRCGPIDVTVLALEAS